MTTDYKDTLNLPKTDFPMKANLANKEPQVLEKWQAQGIYQQIRGHGKGKKKFILHMGPPYANGDIHIGHALTTILKDIIVKSKSLSGYDAPLVPGWDCHGLPIEVNVEKKIGVVGDKVTAKEFRAKCREYAMSQIDLQRNSFVRLGIFADWEKPYITMDYQYQANIVRSFGKILSRGYLQQGAKPVHWCVNCGSSLAEAEVEYQNKTSPAIDVGFKVKDVPHFLKTILGENTGSVQNIAFVIWTTTPWTLPANQAVALHPDLAYVLVKANFTPEIDAICVLSDLLPDCLKRYGTSEYEVIATFKGKQVENHLLVHPFLEKTVPLVLGEHVTTDAGTGAVHTAPEHGLDDYLVGAHYGLKPQTKVDSKGCFFEEVPFVGTLHVFKANDKIIELIQEKNNLLHATTLEHSYPHCWRHKTPLIFRATPQWFISMAGLRENTLAEIEKVTWVPQWGQSRMKLMIEGRPDWCISRQRTWGVPLVLVLHQDNDTLHPKAIEIIEYVAKLIECNGVEAWHDCDLNDLPFEDMASYRKSNDILDVWFDSGASHFAVVSARDDLQFPADLYLEGSDQHRGWFQTSLLNSMAMHGQAPYKAVLTHGFTVDAKGRKMSKSLGNVVAPEKVVKTLGADILRLWVASTDYKGEIHVSDEILTRMSDAYRRIRNTMRFLLANLDGFLPNEHCVKDNELVALDAWILTQAQSLQQEIMQAYDSYQFHLIYQKIHNFCVVELGSFYLDVIKDRQYTTKTNGQPRRSAQTVMYYIAHALTRWLAPILSFTAQEIWEHLPGDKASSVFLSEWFEFPQVQLNQAMNNDFWQSVMQVRNSVNKALEGERQQGKIGAPLDAKVTLFADGELYSNLMQLKQELRFVLITSEAVVKPLTEKQDAIATDLPTLWLKVEKSTDEKCARCWHHREDVNQHAQYPQLCRRCVDNIDSNSEGEVRHYA
ncbi:MAG: isoleucine--tRNA ligase [Candidatus Berkiella sp.]